MIDSRGAEPPVETGRFPEVHLTPVETRGQNPADTQKAWNTHQLNPAYVCVSVAKFTKCADFTRQPKRKVRFITDQTRLKAAACVAVVLSHTHTHTHTHTYAHTVTSLCPDSLSSAMWAEFSSSESVWHVVWGRPANTLTMSTLLHFNQNLSPSLILVYSNHYS